MGKLADIVSKFSPLVGSALSIVSPIGGVMFNLICKAFGLATSSSESDVSAAVASDPDAAVKIKQIETEHLDVLTQCDTQIRLAAYDRDTKIVTAGGKDWILSILAILFTVGFFAYISMGIFWPKIYDKGTFHDLLNVIMLILSFFYGSAYRPNPNK